jgi:hypothetical protein
VKPRVQIVALLSLAACGSAAAQTAIPNGVKLGASGFATVEKAPPSPFPDRLPPPENRPKNETGFYARMAGISDSEAQKRVAEQRAARPEFARVIGTLRAREAGNFTDARVVHKPDWAYLFYFKRDPAATLAKYTRNPHFKAAQARYSRDELEAIARPWVERFSRHRLLGGHGSDATYGEVRMDLVVSEGEFRAIAEREKWQVPMRSSSNFRRAWTGRRYWRKSARSSESSAKRPCARRDQPGAAGRPNRASRRVLLRNGRERADRLAYFSREVALGVDEQGYLALRTRGSAPRHLGRIGEPFSWGGPIGTSETMPMVRELRARCGNAPLEHVGIPESSRLFEVRPWVIDAIAARRKISRDEAWRRFKKCLEERETRKGGGPLDCDTI